MKSNNLRSSYEIKAPANFMGKYIRSNGGAGSWSWYKDGDPKLAHPHFTVSNNSHEVSKEDDWIGFHITLANYRQNIHIHYTVTQHGAVFHSVEWKGILPDVKDEAEPEINANALNWDQFAAAIYQAVMLGALNDNLNDQVIGIKGLFGKGLGKGD